MTLSSASAADLLPPSDPQREALHNEVHARPQAAVPLPALVIFVAVLNRQVSRAQECAHLRLLPGQANLQEGDLSGNFLGLRLDGYALRWERHTEFTRYSIVQDLPVDAALGSAEPVLAQRAATPEGWLRAIPGEVIAAIELAILPVEAPTSDAVVRQAKDWMGSRAVVASAVGGNGHVCAMADFILRSSGFERMLVLASPGTTWSRAGRIVQRLVELETYRLMALRGLPVAKQLGPVLTQAELALARIATQLEVKSTSDQDLLDTLVSLAAQVERSTADHIYRFSATRAYDGLVKQRIAELREGPIPGSQTLGEFMQRRLSPAIATVSSTEQRLASLSERVSRASALLRTRVDIATEGQNQRLLEKLTNGQELQLQLQTMVEGLSIAAISYYVISLLGYVLKALKGMGWPIDVEISTGIAIPLALAGVWLATRRIHRTLTRRED